MEDKKESRRKETRREEDERKKKLDELRKDEKLQHLLENVTSIIGEYAHHLTNQITRLSEIGIALSSEHDLEKLLEMIVDEARRFTSADAGTLYIIEDEHLVFKIMQNESMNTRMGGTSGKEITLPPVPLKKENVSAYVALSGEKINIPDVYESDLFDFTGPRKYDQATGYRTKSMLVSPLRNQDDEIIGVLQLINASNPMTNEVIAFSPDFVALTESLASQAAVAITNAKLIANMEELFNSFVKVMATAIDEKSPYTGGHIKRVAQLSVLMCEVINGQTEGKFREVFFDEDQIKEMTMAGWMHDLGKITTPVHVVDKGTKLETIYDRIDLIKNRFYLIEEQLRNHWLARKLKMVENGEPAEKIAEGEQKTEEDIKKSKEDLEFVISSNKGGEFMDDGKLDRIKEIGAKTFNVNGNEINYLTDDEIANLSIRKGTLLDSERKIMQDHVVLTDKMLNQIPFTKKLQNIPRFAASHHEHLDGTGYPKGLKGDEIPMEARILCLVDFYEALTASDRPYKKAMPIEKVFAILKGEAERGKLDKDLFDLFVKENVHELFNKQSPKEEPKTEKAPEPKAKVAVSADGKETVGKTPVKK